MAEKRPDRRVGRTRRRLKEALLELIQERGYDGITIQEITRRADVGRSTFYSHFASKEDLLFSGFDHWLHSLALEVPAGGRAGDGPARFRFSLPLLRHIRSQHRFFQATIEGASGQRIRRRTAELLAELVELELARRGPSEAAEAAGVGGEGFALAGEARAHGVVGAFLGLASWWLSAGDALGAEAMDEVFQGLVAGVWTPGRVHSRGQR